MSNWKGTDGTPDARHWNYIKRTQIMVPDMNIPIKRRLVIFWENNIVGSYDLLEDGDELFTYDPRTSLSQNFQSGSRVSSTTNIVA